MLNKIDEESRYRKRLRTDLDKFRYTYQTQEVDQESGTNVTINFVSPSMFVYDHFRFFLLKNSVLKNFDTKHSFRPDYLSYDEYGTTTLWTLILYLNNIPNIEEFYNINKLYIPTMDSIYRVADDIITAKPKNITPVIRLSKNGEAKVFSKKSRPNLIEQTPFTQIKKPDDFYFMRQIFTIRNQDLVNQFIDLSQDAIPQSISFKIKGLSPFVYDHDYTLISNNSGKPRRITWNRRNVLGDGLLDIMELGMVLEIQYSKLT